MSGTVDITVFGIANKVYGRHRTHRISGMRRYGVKRIFVDTDLGSDCDDGGALASLWRDWAYVI